MSELYTDEPTVVTPEESMLTAGITLRPIPAIAEPTPELLRQVIAGRAGPMLFKGLCDTWRARRAWIPSYLRRDHGDRIVTALLNLPSGGVLFPQDQALYEQTLPFGQFIDEMMSATAAAPCYLAYQRAEEIFEESDYDFGSLVADAEHGSDTRVWIGSAGTRSMLHSDLKDNLFCQIWGRKSVTLLPWKDSRAAYPFTDNLVNSQVDLANVDIERHPRLREVTFYNSMVEPGDILFIPKGCWHDIRACTPSVSINHWFGEPQRPGEYFRLLARLGPRYWLRTVRDFAVHGLLRRRERTLFFFSPPSTGKRLFDAVSRGSFSRANDPSN
jgi:hypothetical protein